MGGKAIALVRKPRRAIPQPTGMRLMFVGCRMWAVESNKLTLLGFRTLELDSVQNQARGIVSMRQVGA